MNTTRSKPMRVHHLWIAGAASLALLGAAPGMSAFGSSADANGGHAGIAEVAPAAVALDIPDDVVFYQARTSILGVHKWYAQYQGSRQVFGGWWGFHRNFETGKVTIDDHRLQVGKVATTPKIGARTATRAAGKATSVAAENITTRKLMVLPGTKGTPARLSWAISSADSSGARITFVDARNATVLKTVVTGDNVRKLTKGTGKVFDPNPIQALQDQSLVDDDDSATAVPAGGYNIRDLPRLKGKGTTLVGKWVKIVNEDRATSPNARYKYNRANEYFEQTMAYYAIDAQEAYLRRLGFADANAEQQHIETNTFEGDNSFYDPAVDLITMGSGGVDDAEDPEVIWHENGHAIQDDQVPNWGITVEGGSIGEAFGDYMAVTMSQRFAPNTAVAPTACVMDWDATSYTLSEPHCLRRTDGDKVYPDDVDGEVHDDGEIWSRALWDMNLALGRDKATTIIVEAQFWMNPYIEFQKAARITVRTAAQLYPASKGEVYQAFQDRGILP